MTNREIIHKLRTDEEARKRFKANLVEKHKAEGDGQDFKRWTWSLLGAAIWNELFVYKGSSHPVSLRGLTRADGRRVVTGYA